MIVEIAKTTRRMIGVMTAGTTTMTGRMGTSGITTTIIEMTETTETVGTIATTATTRTVTEPQTVLIVTRPIPAATNLLG